MGKKFDDTLKDKNNCKVTTKQFKYWLPCIDKSDLSGKYKAWCVHHSILPEILWTLMTDKISGLQVEKKECVISLYPKRDKRVR